MESNPIKEKLVKTIGGQRSLIIAIGTFLSDWGRKYVPTSLFRRISYRTGLVITPKTLGKYDFSFKTVSREEYSEMVKRGEAVGEFLGKPYRPRKNSVLLCKPKAGSMEWIRKILKERNKDIDFWLIYI